MCGCEIYIHCKQLKRTLISWRRRHANNKNCYKYVVFPDGNVLHETTRDAVNTMICSKQSSISLSHLKCVFRQYDNCSKYNVPKYESRCSTAAPNIKFRMYVLFSTCSLHRFIGEVRLIFNLCENKKWNGKIRGKKMLTQRELTISNFMYDVYLSSWEKYIYHVHCVKLFRRLIVKNFEKILATLNLEIYYQYETTLKECLLTLISKYNLIILETEEVYPSKGVW